MIKEIQDVIEELKLHKMDIERIIERSSPNDSDFRVGRLKGKVAGLSAAIDLLDDVYINNRLEQPTQTGMSL